MGRQNMSCLELFDKYTKEVPFDELKIGDIIYINEYEDSRYAIVISDLIKSSEEPKYDKYNCTSFNSVLQDNKKDELYRFHNDTVTVFTNTDGYLKEIKDFFDKRV